MSENLLEGFKYQTRPASALRRGEAGAGERGGVRGVARVVRELNHGEQTDGAGHRPGQARNS